MLNFISFGFLTYSENHPDILTLSNSNYKSSVDYMLVIVQFFCWMKFFMCLLVIKEFGKILLVICYMIVYSFLFALIYLLFVMFIGTIFASIFTQADPERFGSYYIAMRSVFDLSISMYTLQVPETFKTSYQIFTMLSIIIFVIIHLFYLAWVFTKWSQLLKDIEAKMLKFWYSYFEKYESLKQDKSGL